jgi:hypothetical protein
MNEDLAVLLGMPVVVFGDLMFCSLRLMIPVLEDTSVLRMCTA